MTRMKATTRNCIHSYEEGCISIFAKRGKNHVVYSHPDSFTIMQDDQVTTSNNNKGMLHSLVLMTFSVQIFAIIKGTVTSWTEHLWLFQYTQIHTQGRWENHIVHRFCLGRVGGSRSSDAPATGWVFVQLIVYSPYVNRTWSLIAFTIFLQVSSFRAAFIYQRGKSTTRKTYKQDEQCS